MSTTPQTVTHNQSDDGTAIAAHVTKLVDNALTTAFLRHQNLDTDLILDAKFLAPYADRFTRVPVNDTCQPVAPETATGFLILLDDDPLVWVENPFVDLADGSISVRLHDFTELKPEPEPEPEPTAAAA